MTELHRTSYKLETITNKMKADMNGQSQNAPIPPMPPFAIPA